VKQIGLPSKENKHLLNDFMEVEKDGEPIFCYNHDGTWNKYVWSGSLVIKGMHHSLGHLMTTVGYKDVAVYVLLSPLFRESK
jgi:hypothetical protein